MIRFAVLAVLLLGATQEELTYRGRGFTLEYPRKNTKLQPSSATVAFQLEYRKNSLFRLETERLTQPIDLSDETFATIFMEVQLESLLERIPVAPESHRLRHFAWGTGIEFVYYVPARSGKKNRRDKVMEVVTTRGETLYRFAYWMRERDLKKVEAPLQKIVESFRPEAPAVASDANAVSDPASWAEHRYSLWGAELGIESYREELSSGEGEGEGPAFAEAQAGLAETLGWKAYLMDGASPSELDEIRRAAAAAMSLAPEDADSQQARAWAAYHDNRLVEMETAIKEALRIEPENAENHLLYALWYGFNPERAEAMADKALEGDPNLVAALYVKALAHRRAGELAQARESLERAVSLDPKFAIASLELADVRAESGDAAGALEAWRAAVAAAPGNVDAHFSLARALRGAGHIDAAIIEYRKVLELDPELSEVYYNLAVVYLREKEQPALAAQNFARFLELDPESERAGQVQAWLRSKGYR